LEKRAVDSESDRALLDTLRAIAEGQVDGDDVQGAISKLREHEVTEATMAEARRVADDAIECLDRVPEGVVKDTLVRFANQVVHRTT